MKKKIKNFHHRIEKIFYLLTEAALKIIATIFGLSSWIYPIVKIWTDVIDEKFNLLNSIGYILVGICLFYTALSLEKILDKIKENNIVP